MSTLSPTITLILNLRILPAVCAKISCPFSSCTLNIALGSFSITVPENSSNSSFDIVSPKICAGDYIRLFKKKIKD